MTVRDEAARLYAARIETDWEQTSDMDQVRAAVLAAAEDPARERDLRALIDSCIGSGVRGALLAQCLSVIQDARAAAGLETTATEEPAMPATTELPRPDTARKPACRITYGTRKDGMPVMYHDYPLGWRLSSSLLPHRGGRTAAGQRLAGTAVFLGLLAAIGLTDGGWRAGLIAVAAVLGAVLIAEASWADWARNRHHMRGYRSVVTIADIGTAEPGTVIEEGTQYLVEVEEWRRARKWHARVRVWTGPSYSKTRGPLVRARLLRPESPPINVVRRLIIWVGLCRWLRLNLRDRPRGFLVRQFYLRVPYRYRRVFFALRLPRRNPDPPLPGGELAVVATDETSGDAEAAGNG